MANAAPVTNVLGQTTDVNDAMWLADCMAAARFRASFMPEAAVQELRRLLRKRKQRSREQTGHVQRLRRTSVPPTIAGPPVSLPRSLCYVAALVGGGALRETIRRTRAGVAELVDALDLGSSDASRGGSNPSARTRSAPHYGRA
jgi:hypothetical protein